MIHRYVQQHFQDWNFKDIKDVLIAEGCDVSFINSKKDIIEFAYKIFTSSNLPVKPEKVVQYVDKDGVQYYTVKTPKPQARPLHEVKEILSRKYSNLSIEGLPPQSNYRLNSLRRRTNQVGFTDDGNMKKGVIIKEEMAKINEEGDKEGNKVITKDISNTTGGEIEEIIAIEMEGRRTSSQAWGEWFPSVPIGGVSAAGELPAGTFQNPILGKKIFHI